MDYRLGTSNKIRQTHDTVALTCPNCNKKVNFGVFLNLERRLKAQLPLPVDCHNVYFLVCPDCAGVFTVDEKVGDSFKNGADLAIGNFDLKKLKSFKLEDDDNK